MNPKSKVLYEDVTGMLATRVSISSDTEQHCQDEIQRCLFIAECAGTWARFDTRPRLINGRWHARGHIGYVLGVKANGE